MAGSCAIPSEPPWTPCLPLSAFLDLIMTPHLPSAACPSPSASLSASVCLSISCAPAMSRVSYLDVLAVFPGTSTLWLHQNITGLCTSLYFLVCVCPLVSGCVVVPSPQCAASFWLWSEGVEVAGTHCKCVWGRWRGERREIPRDVQVRRTSGIHSQIHSYLPAWMQLLGSHHVKWPRSPLIQSWGFLLCCPARL